MLSSSSTCSHSEDEINRGSAIFPNLNTHQDRKRLYCHPVVVQRHNANEQLQLPKILPQDERGGVLKPGLEFIGKYTGSVKVDRVYKGKKREKPNQTYVVVESNISRDLAEQYNHLIRGFSEESACILPPVLVNLKKKNQRSENEYKTREKTITSFKRKIMLNKSRVRSKSRHKASDQSVKKNRKLVIETDLRNLSSRVSYEKCTPPGGGDGQLKPTKRQSLPPKEIPASTSLPTVCKSKQTSRFGVDHTLYSVPKTHLAKCPITINDKQQILKDCLPTPSYDAKSIDSLPSMKGDSSVVRKSRSVKSSHSTLKSVSLSSATSTRMKTTIVTVKETKPLSLVRIGENSVTDPAENQQKQLRLMYPMYDWKLQQEERMRTSTFSSQVMLARTEMINRISEKGKQFTSISPNQKLSKMRRFRLRNSQNVKSQSQQADAPSNPIETHITNVKANIARARVINSATSYLLPNPPPSVASRREEVSFTPYANPKSINDKGNEERRPMPPKIHIHSEEGALILADQDDVTQSPPKQESGVNANDTNTADVIANNAGPRVIPPTDKFALQTASLAPIYSISQNDSLHNSKSNLLTVPHESYEFLANEGVRPPASPTSSVHVTLSPHTFDDVTVSSVSTSLSLSVNSSQTIDQKIYTHTDVGNLQDEHEKGNNSINPPNSPALRIQTLELNVRKDVSKSDVQAKEKQMAASSITGEQGRDVTIYKSTASTMSVASEKSVSISSKNIVFISPAAKR